MTATATTAQPMLRAADASPMSASPPPSPDKNELDYREWKELRDLRSRICPDKFNLFRDRHQERMFNHAQYKQESMALTDMLKDRLERRLSDACLCDTCVARSKQSP